MRNISLHLHRRRFLVAAAAIAGVLPGGAALGLTGVAAIDTPSIPVRAPARVLLVAITRAGSRLVAAGEHGVIIYSGDRGKTWRQAAVPVNVTLTCLAFATPSQGWAAGHFGVVLATLDGGATWSLQLNGVQANQLTLAAAQAPWVQNNPSPAAPMAMKRAAHFIDEGPDKPFFCLLAFGAGKILGFGAYRMAMISNDAGKDWADWSLHVYDAYSHNIYDAAAIGSDIYLVGEEGLVFRSGDSGQTFLPAASPADITLFGVLGAADSSVLTFGVAGRVFRSTDGAKTWAPVTLALQDDITGGRVLKSGEILLVSGGGGLFKSRDHGVTFQQIPGIQPMPFFDLEEAPDGNLILVGAAGVTALSRNLLSI
jgi:photosystem II stability/assembly factor-like uncharacterized protein